jgi:RNase P protein component
MIRAFIIRIKRISKKKKIRQIFQLSKCCSSKLLMFECMQHSKLATTVSAAPLRRANNRHKNIHKLMRKAFIINVSEIKHQYHQIDINEK